MDNLPKLLKPYYEISETFLRLNLAGANLDKEDDIFIIGREGDIELSLILNESISLVNHSYASPLEVHKRFNFEPSDDDVEFALKYLDYTQDTIKIEFARLNNPTLMIPHYLYDGDLVDAVEKVEAFYTFEMTPDKKKERLNACIELLEEETQNLNEFINSRCNLRPPKVINPYSVRKDFDNNLYLEPQRVNIAKHNDIDVVFSLCAVGIENEIYYTCESVDYSYFSEMVTYKVTFNDGKEYWPSSVLRHHYLFDAIKNKQFVVTRSAIQNYEEEYLGITKANVKNLPRKMQNRREKVLETHIKAYSLEHCKSLGRLDLWKELTEVDHSLFPVREDPKDSTVKKFFDNQSLITFKRGR